MAAVPYAAAFLVCSTAAMWPTAGERTPAAAALRSLSISVTSDAYRIIQKPAIVVRPCASIGIRG